MTRDYSSEDASRTRGRLTLRLTEEEREELAALATRLGATTQAGAVLAALAATRALLAGESAAVALAAAREAAATPPPKRGWTKGKPRG
jgi:cysteine synthase